MQHFNIKNVSKIVCLHTIMVSFAQSRFLWLVTSLWSLLHAAESRKIRPNIIFMFGDDLGFNELGYLGCTDTKTPRMDDLAMNEGLVLWHNYVSKICSPSRSAFLSGRYPSTLGLQNLVFNTQWPVSLTRQVSIISEEFNANGYSTHMIGKWHLGYTSWEYTPLYRGFDTFTGYYGGLSDYYNHSQCMPSQMHPDSALCYYDLRNGDDEDWDGVAGDQYGTFFQRDQVLELLESKKDQNVDEPFFLYLAWQSSHEPDEAPEELIAYYHDDPNEEVTSRHYCQAQTTALDQAVGSVTDYLKENGMWNETLIVFSSDNGGQYNRHDNSPLRGFKNTSFEGGLRVPAFVTGGYLNDNRKGQVAENLMVSVVDWYPTLLAAAGIEIGYHISKKMHNTDKLDTRFDDDGVGNVPLDGRNLWDAIQFGDDYITNETSTESRELLLDLNKGGSCSFSSCGAIRYGHWKFIRGENMGVNSSTTSGVQWHSDFTTCEQDKLGCSDIDVSDEALICYKMESGCLFDLKTDACEHRNVGDENVDVRNLLMGKLDYYQSIAAPILINADSDMAEEIWDPASIGNKFWGPYYAYNNTFFEETLQTKYRMIYPDSGDTAKSKSTMKWLWSSVSMNNGSGKLMGKHYIGIAMMILTVALLFAAFNRFQRRKYAAKSISEEAPLLTVKSLNF